METSAIAAGQIHGTGSCSPRTPIPNRPSRQNVSSPPGDARRSIPFEKDREDTVMHRAREAGIAALLALPLLAGCGVTIDPSALDDDPFDPSAELPAEEPIPASPAEAPIEAPVAEFPIAGSVVSQMKSADGYYADLSVTWSSLITFNATEALELLPECEEQINRYRESGATDANVYAFRVEGSLTYPVVDGFQRPAVRLMDIALHQHYDSAAETLNSFTTSRPACEGDATPQPPAGGGFIQTVVFPVSKVPNNPDGELKPQPGGFARADIPVEDWLRTDLKVDNGLSDIDCTNAMDNSGINAPKNECRFLMEIPLG